MKKIIIYICTFFLVISFCGCKKDKKSIHNNEINDLEETETKDEKIKTTTIDYYVDINEFLGLSVPDPEKVAEREKAHAQFEEEREKLGLSVSEYQHYLFLKQVEEDRKNAEELGISYEDCVCLRVFHRTFNETKEVFAQNGYIFSFNESGSWYIQMSEEQFDAFHERMESYSEVYIIPAITILNIDFAEALDNNGELNNNGD